MPSVIISGKGGREGREGREHTCRHQYKQKDHISKHTSAAMGSGSQTQPLTNSPGIPKHIGEGESVPGRP